MQVITILFFVLVCRCLGFAEQVPDTATIQNGPLEDKLATLLRAHDNKWASLLEANTAYLLREQEAKMADLTTLLQHQESLLQEQGARLSFQEALLLKQGRTIQQPKNRHVPPQSFPNKNFRHATDTSQSETPLPGNTSESASHDVMPRSDDAEPWEAVMSHISEQVTEMGADIQALKTQTSGDIQSLQNSNRQQDLAIQDAQSSTFVHWGSSTCSNLSHTVYSGVVGGSSYHQSGAATNYLCLTMSPVFSDHPIPQARAYLYGGEYGTYDSHHDKDPVCAVCRSTMSTTMMIPGTNVCTPGWNLQYSGLLMAGWSDDAAGSEFICVDSKLENNVRGDADEDGAELLYTVTHCGSLPCTPYVNNKVVTCAVCSK